MRTGPSTHLHSYGLAVRKGPRPRHVMHVQKGNPVVMTALDSPEFRAALEHTCPHTDCDHLDTYRCSGWAYVVDVFEGLEEAGFVILPANDPRLGRE